MSWSVSATGRGDEVAKAIADQFFHIPLMAQPEDAIAREVGKIVHIACSAAPTCVFKVRAEGHQYQPAAQLMQAMHLKVEIDLVPLAE